MLEEIRLVIWDLDETFWQGTLSENGISYVQQNHDIVMELCRRGIMNTICSKNDFDQTRQHLELFGIWEYFIFPSISWDSKAERLKNLVDEIGLRPSTVMFIDDNHHNRAEAAALIPDLKIEDETFLPRLLKDPRFAGKADDAMTRLHQYKVLESKRHDRIEAKGNNEAFLRSSEIRVFIDHDVEKHIDRAVELVNRTNSSISPKTAFLKIRTPREPHYWRTSAVSGTWRAWSMPRTNMELTIISAFLCSTLNGANWWKGLHTVV